MPAAPIIGGVIGAVGAIGGSVIGGSAARKAGNAQAQATMYAAELQYEAQQKALDAQLEMFYSGQEETAYLRDIGRKAGEEIWPMIQEGPPEFQFDKFSLESDPGYQFRLSQGSEAINRMNAASGGGAAGLGKELVKFSQGLASDETAQAYGRYQDAYSKAWQESQAPYMTRLNALNAALGFGQVASQNSATNAMQTGQNMANTYMSGAQNMGNLAIQGANARAGSLMGGANAAIQGISGGIGAINQGINNYLYNQAMGQTLYNTSVPQLNYNTSGGYNVDPSLLSSEGIISGI